MIISLRDSFDISPTSAIKQRRTEQITTLAIFNNNDLYTLVIYAKVYRIMLSQYILLWIYEKIINPSSNNENHGRRIREFESKL